MVKESPAYHANNICNLQVLLQFSDQIHPVYWNRVYYHNFRNSEILEFSYKRTFCKGKVETVTEVDNVVQLIS